MKGNVSDIEERRKKEWYCNHTLPCPLPQLTVYYQVPSDMFPKLGILLLLYKACIKMVLVFLLLLLGFFCFFSLVQQSSPRSESQCSCGHFRCAPFSTAADIWALAQPRSDKVVVDCGL